VCSEKHLPSLVRNADRLRQAGVGQLVCVVTSDPWSVDAWTKVVDPARKVRFVSDGNLSFTRALGLSTHEPKLFIGERSERYMLTVRNGAIESARIEDHIANLVCTEPDDFVLEEV
jgi:peroxiredoxin